MTTPAALPATPHTPTVLTAPTEPIIVDAQHLNVSFGNSHALKDVTLPIPAKRVTALMGPSGSGKSTFLRALNRMHDRTPSARVTGQVLFDGQDILGPGLDIVQLRQRMGMIFQKPVVFPKSIFENVAFAVRVQGGLKHAAIADRVEHSLRQAALWDEVKDRLRQSAVGLSGGQQQRLCIARALAVEPEVLLLDEPTSALDPVATLKVEDLVRDLAQTYTIAIVTHNLQQAGRLSHYSGFFLLGSLIEFGPTQEVFERPRDKRTEDFITGRFG
ncbi:MAG: phosphate ABC transporter ATP-binding protein [Ktedonobacterales bacterium]|nr:phosphate ABC transporter ATP-binding protein [Ktedonobacterales bacterium]